MGESSTKVQIGENHFDVAGVGGWIADNIWIFLLIAFIAFIFHLFQVGGFAEKWLEFRIRGKELDAKQLDDARAITDMMRRKFDRDEPFLPFDDERPKIK